MNFVELEVWITWPMAMANVPAVPPGFIKLMFPDA
jgi:hypothetical protein